MKKIYCFLSIAALAFVGCDMNDPNADKFGADTQKGFVEFQSEATNVITGGGQTQFSVPVVLDAPVNSSGLTVNYTVADISGSTAGYITHSGKVSIPSGELVGNIMFTIPDSERTDCPSFQITLTSTSRGNVTVGLNEESQITHIVKLGRGRDSFVGTYDVVEGDDEYVAEITVGEAPNELIISNLFDIDDESTTSVFLVSGSSTDNVVFPTFTENFLFASTNPAQGNVYVSSDFTLPSSSDGIHIGSFFDACNQSLTLNYFLVFGPEQELTDPNDGTSINAVFTKRP